MQRRKVWIATAWLGLSIAIVGYPAGAAAATVVALGASAEIEKRLRARGIGVVMLENSALRGLPHQADGQHLTPEGYRMLAESLVSQVAGALGR